MDSLPKFALIATIQEKCLGNDNVLTRFTIVYSLPFYLGACKAADYYADQLRDTINSSVPKGKLGAFFAEPIQVKINAMFHRHCVCFSIG